MSVGMRVGNIVDEVGTEDFLHAFFVTIYKRLEPTGWGTRFPTIMNDLYQGKLSSSKIKEAEIELHLIRKELQKHDPKSIVWDAENLSLRPPWGNNISKEITSLGNYFVTNTGRDLFDLLFECLQAAQKQNSDLIIEQF